MAKKVWIVPCFCVSCGKNKKVYSLVLVRTRTIHEDKDTEESKKKREDYPGGASVLERIIWVNTSTEGQQSEDVEMALEMAEADSSSESEVDLFKVTDLEAEKEAPQDLEELDINLDHVEEEENSDPIDFEDSPEEEADRPEPLAILFMLMMHMLIGRYINDECAEIILAFLNVALSLTGNHYRFPVKLSTFKSHSRFEDFAFSGVKTFVSCTLCHSIYDIPTNNDEREKIMQCTPTKRINLEDNRVLEYCNNNLFDINKNNLLVPKAYFLYNSIIDTIKKFYLRSGFAEAVTAWKKRKLTHLDYMSDCYDANVFKNYKLDSSSTESFVDEDDHNHMFSFNVDWYQQFNSSAYSCGAMYLTCLNLPTSIRNLRENMIFDGLILPGGNGEAR